MKNKLVILALCSFFASPAFAKFTGVEGAIKKLEAARVHDLKTADENTALTDADVQAQDKAFDALSHAVVVAIKESSVALTDEVLKTAVVLLRKDPTQYAGEIVAPLLQKKKDLYMESLRKLSPADAKLVDKAVHAALRELKSGNG